MRFSARSLLLAHSRRDWSVSSAVVRPRAAVPFMGRVRTSSPTHSRNSSGLALATA